MDKLLKTLLDNYKNNTSNIFTASRYWKDKNQIKYYKDFIETNSHNKTLNSFIFYQNKNRSIVNSIEFKKIFYNFKFKRIKYQRLDNLTKDILLINK